MCESLEISWFDKWSAAILFFKKEIKIEILKWIYLFIYFSPNSTHRTVLCPICMLKLEVWRAQSEPRVLIGWVMILLTLSYTTRLERPELTSGPLYHYLRLFTVKCLVWMGCGVEFSSPQRTRFFHILRPCTCLMFSELMSCGACNVSFGDVSRGF